MIAVVRATSEDEVDRGSRAVNLQTGGKKKKQTYKSVIPTLVPPPKADTGWAYLTSNHPCQK